MRLWELAFKRILIWFWKQGATASKNQGPPSTCLLVHISMIWAAGGRHAGAV